MSFIKVCSDWELLDMVEGLRHQTTLEQEMAKRFRLRLEAERKARFEAPALPPALDVTDLRLVPSEKPGEYLLSATVAPVR